MENLIFVGGLQYSGKSYFARNLEKSRPSRYKYIGVDELCEQLTQRRDVFMGLIKRYDKDLHGQIENLGRQMNVRGDCNLLTLFANYMIEAGRFGEFEDMQQLYVLLHASEIMVGLKKGVTAVVDGAFTNKISRQVAYQTLRVAFGRKVPIDELRKLFIYFNLGLDLSLERFRKDGREGKSALRWDEALVRRTFKEQEIPATNELPNLEVAVINNPDELEQIVNRLSLGV